MEKRYYIDAKGNLYQNSIKGCKSLRGAIRSRTKILQAQIPQLEIKYNNEKDLWLAISKNNIEILDDATIAIKGSTHRNGIAYDDVTDCLYHIGIPYVDRNDNIVQKVAHKK